MASGSGWNLWVWLAGSGCGWNVWVWLVYVVVRRYIDFLILPYLPEYKSTFYDPKWMVKSRPRLIHRIIKLR